MKTTIKDFIKESESTSTLAIIAMAVDLAQSVSDYFFNHPDINPKIDVRQFEDIDLTYSEYIEYKDIINEKLNEYEIGVESFDDESITLVPLTLQGDAVYTDRYPEFNPLIQEACDMLAKYINDRALKIKSEMSYPKTYVLEEVIKKLQKLV